MGAGTRQNLNETKLFHDRDFKFWLSDNIKSSAPIDLITVGSDTEVILFYTDIAKKFARYCKIYDNNYIVIMLIFIVNVIWLCHVL